MNGRAVFIVLGVIAVLLLAMIHDRLRAIETNTRDAVTMQMEAEARALVGDAMYECGNRGCDD